MEKTELPIAAYREAIMSCNAPYFIVEAETGSGKTTQVPRWFYERGLSVLVTAPRIETVIGTAEYLAIQMDSVIGATVGFATSQHREYSRQTRILFCTDGLALVRELAGWKKFDVLLLDELHEWNTNQSTLEAWVYDQILDGTSHFKQVGVLSATMDTAELSRLRGNAPVFRVPGRQYEIVDRPRGKSIEADVKTLVEEGHDVLVFQPGKGEIDSTIAKLGVIGAEVMPFYADLSRADKDKVYISYPRPKVIVSTNALETGRTLPPSAGRQLAVVDSGLERRLELSDAGIEALVLAPIAHSNSAQRRGRTGRLGPGIYIDHCRTPRSRRPAYPIPELNRTRIDQMVLRLASAGFNATKLPFFHRPNPASIAEARRTLHCLGAVAADGISVTKIGQLVARLPLSVSFARMIVAAVEANVVEDVITVASILEVGGIRSRKSFDWQDLIKETTSDLLAELDLWQMADGGTAEDLEEMGLSYPAFRRSEEIRLKLYNVLCSLQMEVSSNGERQAILFSCATGMINQIFRRADASERVYSNNQGDTRMLDQYSVLTGKPEWIVGIPMDIGSKRIITMASAVPSDWLAKSASHIVQLDKDQLSFRAVR